MIAGNGEDVRVGGIKRFARSRCSSDFKLRHGGALKSLHQHQVHGSEAAQNGGKRGLWRVAQLPDVRHPPRRDDGHFAGTGRPVAGAVGPRLVDVKAVVRMLDRRHRQAAPGELGDKRHRQGRLAAVLPAGNPDHCRGRGAPGQAAFGGRQVSRSIDVGEGIAAALGEVNRNRHPPECGWRRRHFAPARDEPSLQCVSRASNRP
jgi:hypothetical protein